MAHAALVGACVAGPLAVWPIAVARAGPAPIVLPAEPKAVTPLGNIGLRKDLLLRSVVPGRVLDREHVTATLGPSGVPSAVDVLQSLHLQGTGGYVIRERGPARSAVAIGQTVPPVLELGTVVWEGFSPGRRSLTARLALDPVLEAARLPLSVTLGFTSSSGRAETLGPTLAAPSDGTLTVTLTDTTNVEQTLPVGAGNPEAVARALDDLLAAAGHPGHSRLPTAGHGLPRSVGGRRTGVVETSLSAAVAVSGSFTSNQPVALTGSGTTRHSDRSTRISGVLDTGAVSFQAKLRRGQKVRLALHVTPTVDPRVLAPPGDARSWSGWAAHAPDRRSVAAATRLLLAQAAVAARADQYVPYLEANLPGKPVTTFTYRTAPEKPIAFAAASGLTPRPGAIAATAVAIIAILGAGAALRRHT